MMETQRTTNGATRTRGDGEIGQRQAIGAVARDVMDHVTMIVRDGIGLARIEARHVADHVRRDVLPRAAMIGVAAALAGLAGLLGLIALFLGIASAIGVAWTFAIYAGFFAVAAVATLALAGRPPKVGGEAIARRFPAAHAREHLPEHGIVHVGEPDGHRKASEEARREAGV
jgi:hypothetical protein